MIWQKKNAVSKKYYVMYWISTNGCHGEEKRQVDSGKILYVHISTESAREICISLEFIIPKREVKVESMWWSRWCWAWITRPGGPQAQHARIGQSQRTTTEHPKDTHAQLRALYAHNLIIFTSTIRPRHVFRVKIHTYIDWGRRGW